MESENLLIVDRITGCFAVCETPDRRTFALLVDDLPPGVKEGDCLREEAGTYLLDEAEMRRRRQRNIDLFNSLLMQEED